MSKPNDIEIESKLLDYLDGNLNSVEANEIKEMLFHNESLRKKLELLRSLDNTLSKNVSLREPSTLFTQNVMRQIKGNPRFTLKSIRNGVILLSAILLTVLVAAALISFGVFDVNSTYNYEIVKNDYFNFTFPQVSVNVKLLIEAIIVLNLILAFLVLDRGILKPLFRRRAEMHL